MTRAAQKGGTAASARAWGGGAGYESRLTIINSVLDSSYSSGNGGKLGVTYTARGAHAGSVALDVCFVEICQGGEVNKRCEYGP